MDEKERLIREFYALRARRDWSAVRALLAEDVGWHEPGEEDFSGDHRGRDVVVALLEKLDVVTGGTFSLEPTVFIVTADHIATNARWHAERDGMRVEGNDLGVFRIRDGKIAEAWFFPDGHDAEGFTKVFSFSES